MIIFITNMATKTPEEKAAEIAAKEAAVTKAAEEKEAAAVAKKAEADAKAAEKAGKAAEGFVRVEAIGCISVHGATVQPGTIIEISEDLFKAFGPDYVKKSSKPVTGVVQVAE